MDWAGLAGVLASLLGLTLAFDGIFINGRYTKRLITEGNVRVERLLTEGNAGAERLIAEQAARVAELIADGHERLERSIVEGNARLERLIVEEARDTDRLLERLATLVITEGERTRAEVRRGQG